MDPRKEAYDYSCSEFLRLSRKLADETDEQARAELLDLISMYRLAAETFTPPSPAALNPTVPEPERRPSAYVYWRVDPEEKELRAYRIELDLVISIEVYPVLEWITVTYGSRSGLGTDAVRFSRDEYSEFPLDVFLDNITMETFKLENHVTTYLRKNWIEQISLSPALMPGWVKVSFRFWGGRIFHREYADKDKKCFLAKRPASFLT